LDELASQLLISLFFSVHWHFRISVLTNIIIHLLDRHLLLLLNILELLLLLLLLLLFL
jgi:hypothetical protein